MIEIPRLNTNEVEASYDLEKKSAYIKYKGVLGAKATKQIYQWISAMVTVFSGQLILHQVTFDFREVTAFDETNLGAAREESKKLHQSFALDFLPAALIAANEQQAEVLRLSLKVSGQQARSKIVFSEAEAEAFFEEWWNTHTRPSGPIKLFPDD